MKIITLLLTLLLATTVNAEGPAEAIKETIKQVRSTVKGSETSDIRSLDKELRDIITPLFDFNEMSRRSLGQSWKEANAAQKKEFIELFSELLSNTYLARIRDNVAESDVQFLSERIKQNRAIIRTKVKQDNQAATIDYRLRNKAGKWVIYDVVIENVGLVSNYRNEFAELVQQGGIDKVLSQLKQKQIELAKQSESA